MDPDSEDDDNLGGLVAAAAAARRAIERMATKIAMLPTIRQNRPMRRAAAIQMRSRTATELRLGRSSVDERRPWHQA